MSRPLRLTLVSLWCGLWPICLAWSSATDHIVIGLVAILVLVATPLVLRHRQVVLRDREVRAHARCHVHRNELLAKLQIHYEFCTHEAVARELERLADSLRDAPPRTLVEPRSLADNLDERVAYVRRVSPNPVLTSIFEFASREPES